MSFNTDHSTQIFQNENGSSMDLGTPRKGHNAPFRRRAFPKVVIIAALLFVLVVLLKPTLQPFSPTRASVANLPSKAVASIDVLEDPTIVEGLEAFREIVLGPLSETACKNVRLVKPTEGTYGEWLMCWDNPPTADAKGLAYTVGVGKNWDFEKTLAAEHHDVHSFDCTVKLSPEQLVPGMTFEKTCLGGHTGKFSLVRGGRPQNFAIGSICDLVNRNKDSGRFMDVLKIDCEGCEWRAFERLFQGCPGLLGANIGQILIEMHMVKSTMVDGDNEYKRMLRVFATLKAHGFVPFWRRITYGGEEHRELLPQVRAALKLAPTDRGFMGYEMGLINTVPREVPRMLKSNQQ
mmetsp:Transcript_2809/g.4268  ORF Transcript_2809/g.4268 Transcript_2809/m.4268 type:complete len:349 (+) Transcript_2809:213-1259(+)